MSLKVLNGKNIFYLFMVLLAVLFFQPLLLLIVVGFLLYATLVVLKGEGIIGKKKD